MLGMVESIDKIPDIKNTAELAIFFEYEWGGSEREGRRKTKLFRPSFLRSDWQKDSE